MMAKKGIVRKDKFGGDLFLCKMVLQRLCQMMTDVGLSYADAVRRFKEIFPWFEQEYENVNGLVLNWNDRKFKQTVCDNPRRRLTRDRNGKAAALSGLVERIIVEGKQLSMEEIAAMRIQDLMRKGGIQYLYAFALVDSHGNRIGTKIGQTNKPSHRMFQVRNSLSAKNLPLKVPDNVRYDAILELESSVDEAKAVELQNKAKMLCRVRGSKMLEGIDYLDTSQGTAVWALHQACQEMNIKYLDKTEFWNSTFKPSNVVQLKRVVS